jgi:GNAT superfamily N-acetyltransferase
VTYRIEPLSGHERANFASGSDALDRYFREQVTQDAKRRVASCFVAVDPYGDVAGYYTICATALSLEALPFARAKRLPRYDSIPAVLLGRLAVAREHRGQGLGAALVFDACQRATRSEIASYGMLVDAKDDNAARFYEHLGFERLGAGRRLIRRL